MRRRALRGPKWSRSGLYKFRAVRSRRCRGRCCRIANAVDEDVIACVEAANFEVASKRSAAFAGMDRHAGRLARQLAQIGGALVLDEFLRKSGDRLRRIDERLCKLARAGRFNLVGRVGVCVRVRARCARDWAPGGGAACGLSRYVVFRRRARRCLRFRFWLRLGGGRCGLRRRRRRLGLWRRLCSLRLLLNGNRR